MPLARLCETRLGLERLLPDTKKKHTVQSLEAEAAVTCWTFNGTIACSEKTCSQSFLCCGMLSEELPLYINSMDKPANLAKFQGCGEAAMAHKDTDSTVSFERGNSALFN